MSKDKSRPLQLAGIAGCILIAFVLIRLQPKGASRPQPLGDAQPPAAITCAAFANNDNLMQAIHGEAQRRLLAAHRYLGDPGEILPPPLKHLYVIISYEQVISSGVNLAQLPIMTAPPTPLLPPVADLVAAYQALKEDDLADLAGQLAAGPDSALSTPFLRAMGKPEIKQLRLAFARAHEDDIVPK
jgi:hypothetical protein